MEISLIKLFNFKIWVSSWIKSSIFSHSYWNYNKIDKLFTLSMVSHRLCAVMSALIELNDGFIEQAEQCTKCLLDSSFALKGKKRSEIFDDVASFGVREVMNQIWVRK
jgi:hypothetical protein